MKKIKEKTFNYLKNNPDVRSLELSDGKNNKGKIKKVAVTFELENELKSFDKDVVQTFVNEESYQKFIRSFK